MAEQNNTNWKAVGIGSALGVTGLSMVPAARSFARSAKALNNIKDNPSEVAASYLEGANRFGKTPLGGAMRWGSSKLHNLANRINSGNASVIDRSVYPAFNKAGFGDSFSNLHYKEFLSKDPKRAYNFWSGVEAMGKPKGRFEAATASLRKNKKYKHLFADKKSGVSDHDHLSTLIGRNQVSKDLLNQKFTVPLFDNKGRTAQRSLGSLNAKYTQTDKTLKNVENALDTIMKRKNVSLPDAIRELGKTNNPHAKTVFSRMALDKAGHGYPQTYYKNTALGAGVITTAGLGTITYGVLDGNKR